jgi:hypothetical protein
MVMNLKKLILEALEDREFGFVDPYHNLALEFESTFFVYAFKRLPRGFEDEFLPHGTADVAEQIMGGFGVIYKGERIGYVLPTKRKDIEQGFKNLRRYKGEKYKDLPVEFYDALVEAIKEVYLWGLRFADEKEEFTKFVDKIYYANPLTNKGKELEDIYDNL